jgi:hypothetical protein
MSMGCFLEKDHSPSEEEVRSALGAQYVLWEQLRQFMLDTYQMTVEMSFGGRKYGWNLWYRKSGKSLVSLYPQQGYLVAQIVLGREEAERAAQLALGENVSHMLDSTPQLHDGRWLFIPVRSRQDVEDVQQLLLIKKRPARRKAETRQD